MLDQLIERVRDGLSRVSDHRKENRSYPMVDCLMAGFAMFALKAPSLLSFRQQYPHSQDNMKRVFGLSQLCGDTAFRSCLDEVRPESVEQQLAIPLTEVRQRGGLDSRKVLGNYLSVTIDATGYFGSSKVSCPHCLVKNFKDGSCQYHHQVLAGVNVHPDQSTVFPVSVEAIMNEDGHKKNDCEINAAKRLLPKIKTALPNDDLLLTMDGLYTTGPMIRLLKANDMRFCMTIKEGYVLIQKKALDKKGLLKVTRRNTKKSKVIIKWTNGLIINGVNQDLLVNYIELEEKDKLTGEIIYRSAWITDIPVDKQNVEEISKVGRSRWKIENETFNTLKNQGYNVEHNYGHGKKYLSTVFVMLAFLAFSVDQVAQHFDNSFQTAWKTCKSKRALWEKLRQVFDLLPAKSLEAIYRFIAKGQPIDYPLLV
jgi:hypothetical protein